MRWRRRWSVALGGLVLVLLAATGCTNSDELNSGVDRFRVEVEIANPSTRFANAGFLVNQLTVRPVDENADAALGPIQIGLFASTAGGIDVDLNGSATTFEATAPLTAGTYRVESLVLLNLLFKQGTPSATPVNCVGAITDYFQVSPTSGLTDFGGDVYLHVTLGGEGNTARVVIDGAALADAFERSWQCGCLIGGTQCLVGLSCGPAQRCTPVNGFRSTDFVAQSPTFVRFE